MEMSDGFVEFLGKFKSAEDLIENLFLKSLTETYLRVKCIESIQELSEPKIRNEFQFDLIHSNNLIKNAIEQNYVTFTSENQIINKDKELRRTDIEFIINGVVKFVVECKKLKAASKSQYIDNGISRFTNHIYITEKEKYAGMCSFIFDGEIDKIIERIKQKIQENSFLQINNNAFCDYNYSFSSTHKKSNNDKILLYHIFFDIKKTI